MRSISTILLLILLSSISGYAYAGDMVFARSPQGTYSFESVAYGNGRIEGASNTVRRYVTDHLGNVRAIVTGAGLVDFGARMYDPHTGRWTTQDPMAWKYLGLSPYNYCGNNPVNPVDPDGAVIETLWDIVNVAADVESLISNIKQHKIGASIADGAGLVLDVAAAIIPIVPGGAGTAIKTVRTGDRVGSSNSWIFYI